MQLDWTNANELAVTIVRRPYDHLLRHCVLPHSNWDFSVRLLVAQYNRHQLRDRDSFPVIRRVLSAGPHGYGISRG
jgi:hypothetical protein